jgi:bifunctional DNA-binding transcriptional regulator/antitoxin component of YhaV-PrlF toxin-antitoxin module
MLADNMLVENAKVMAKGQITLPKDTREALDAGMSGRVTLICRESRVVMMNSAVYGRF